MSCFPPQGALLPFPISSVLPALAINTKFFSIVDEYLNCLVGSRVTFNDGGIFTRSDGEISDRGEMLQIDLGFSQQFTSLPFSINSSVGVIFNLIMSLHFFAASFYGFYIEVGWPRRSEINCLFFFTAKSSPIMIFNCKHCGNKF
jgi:hypothetical protein